MRINDKIQEIETYLFELSEIIPPTFEEYKDLRTKAACERYFEKVIEAIVDLSFLVIKDKNFKIPEEDKEAFDTLAWKGLISRELAEKLRAAKGMRNILAHEYGSIEDELVFHSISEELEQDANLFLNSIKKAYNSSGAYL